MLLGQILVPAAVAVSLTTAAVAGIIALRAGRHNRTGTGEAEDAVAAAAEAFTTLSLGTALLVALAASVAAGTVVGAVRNSVAAGGATGVAVAAGGLLSVASSLAGTMFAVGAGGRDWSRHLRKQLWAGAVTSLLAAAAAVGGVAGLFATFTRFLDHSAGEAALEVAGFALGASVVGFITRTGAGVFAESSLLSNELLPQLDPNITPSDRRNASAATRAAGHQAADNAAFAAGVLADMTAGLTGTLVLASWIYELTDDSGWLLLPVLVAAIGLLSAVLGLLALFLLGPRSEEQFPAVTAGHWIAVVTGAAAVAAVSFAVLDEGWFWAAVCVMLGLAGGVVLRHAVRAYIGGKGSPARLADEADRMGAAPSLLASAAVGMEATGTAALTVAVLIGGAALGGIQAAPTELGDASAASLGVALATTGILMVIPYLGSVNGLRAMVAAGRLEPAPNDGDDRWTSGESGSPIDTTAAESRTVASVAAVLVVAVLLSAFATRLPREFAGTFYDKPARAVELTQDAGLAPYGLDVVAGMANAIADYRTSLESCGLDAATVENLLVRGRIETAALLAAGNGRAGEDAACAVAENGSPLPLPSLVGAGPTRPEVLIGVMAGLTVALVTGALVLRSVWSTAGRVAGEVRRQIRDDPEIAAGEKPPDAVRIANIAARAGLLAVVRPGLVILFLLIGGGLALRFAPGTAGNGGWLAVQGMIAGAIVGSVLLGALPVFAGAVRGRTVPAPRSAAEGRPMVSAETFRSPQSRAAGPAVQASGTLLAVAALVLVPLFVG